MSTKLTLRLDEELIARAKEHARQRETSVSQMVAEFFSLLEADAASWPEAETPVVARLRGSLRDTNLSREDYDRYLERKYL